jgi:hypothetical protein
MTRLSSILALGAFAGVANAECPNACSGNGICVQYDMCQCYRNWQGNDCSERSCPMGYAHVDSPLGDMDMSGGALSGPGVTTIAGSEAYPMGTTEQYPDAGSNEAHFYMECSNKGLCDRKSGDCECFDGYDGAACERASCPGGHGGSSEQCSGHGSCHSIAVLTEKHSYSGLPLEVRDMTQAYYGLWDKNATRGCDCDPPYTGADCSSRACKVGVDPLFSGHASLNAPFFTLECTTYTADGTATDVTPLLPTGTFTILFTDSFGQTYRTEKLAADADKDQIEAALLAIPNGVVPAVTATDLSETAFDTLANDGNAYAWRLEFPQNPGARAALQIDTSDINCDPTEGNLLLSATPADGTDLGGHVRLPNVGFRSTGEDAEAYSNHATELAYARNGHKLVYFKGAIPGTSGDLQVVKIEGKLYVVEEFGALAARGLYYAMLHTPFEGTSVLGDSDEQSPMLEAVASAQLTLASGHISNMWLTDAAGAAAGSGMSSAADLDGDGVDEALDPFIEGEYYLLQFDTMTYGDAVAAANAAYDPAGGASRQAGEYCIVHIGTTQGAEDKTSGTSTDGDALIGDNFADSPDTSITAGGLSVAVSTTNCPVGYEKLPFTATAATSPVFTTDAGFVPVKISRFHLTRENAVSTKYQSTHDAAGGAFLKSAYHRTTSQQARGTTRVYTSTSDAATLTVAESVGDASSLQAFLGDNVVLVDAAATGDAVAQGDIVLVGTQLNVVSSPLTLAAASDQEIVLQQLFAGSGENQWSGDEQRDETVYGALNIPGDDTVFDVPHEVTLYKIPTVPSGSYDYVLECSGRGNCDGTSGVCKCFKGYTNDNCDSQSALFSGK